MIDKTKKILVTGAAGQIGSELTLALRKRYGHENVIVTDIVRPQGPGSELEPFEFLDVLDRTSLAQTIKKYSIGIIYHMAAVLSATGEINPSHAWNVNINGLVNILEASRELGVRQVFSPSSIAVFGPLTPRQQTPQDTILDPRTIYGVTKVTGELLGDYYVNKYGLDVRGCRYPGIISHQTLPGGGTTDYAVTIFYEAVKSSRFTCFLKENTRLPMMYMPDCLKCTINLMEADFVRLKHHANFNVAAFSCTPAELASEIKKHIPAFVCNYEPDFHQAIADSWPESIDDRTAREEWGWQPDYDLRRMTAEMIEVLSQRQAEGKLNY